jgi:uncharacterized protein
MKNSVKWFEIPAKNFERAKKFYGTVLDSEIELMEHPTHKYGLLPSERENGGIGGAIVKGEGYEPSDKGPIVYLNGGKDLTESLHRVEKAGGKVLVPKTSLGENGFMAIFTDTENNRVGLYSLN